MKRLILAAIVAMVMSCDTPPSSENGTDAGASICSTGVCRTGSTAPSNETEMSQQTQVIAPGGGVDPIVWSCIQQWIGCRGVCQAAYSSWCPWCVVLCVDTCDRQYNQCRGW